jgi:hypothetical protein
MRTRIVRPAPRLVNGVIHDRRLLSTANVDKRVVMVETRTRDTRGCRTRTARTGRGGPAG